jgi:hypothetical protein
LANEAELGALFLNTQEAKVIQLLLEELGHLQPPTPIHINNTTTMGIVNNTIKRQQSQAIEMWFFWLLEGKVQKLFQFLLPTWSRELRQLSIRTLLHRHPSTCPPILCAHALSPLIS